MGSNMAECHPVAFRWVMKGKEKGGKLIHVDPRFTRTSAWADKHVAIRAGSDIAFLGGVVNWLINNPRWLNSEFHRSYVQSYTHMATLIDGDSRTRRANHSWEMPAGRVAGRRHPRAARPR